MRGMTDEIAVAGLASWRLSRLMTVDDISAGVRDEVLVWLEREAFNRSSPVLFKLRDAFECRVWCITFWSSMIVAAVPALRSGRPVRYFLATWATASLLAQYSANAEPRAPEPLSFEHG